MTEPIVHACFEPQTSTWQYVVADPATKSAVIIDPVLDFDPARNTVSTETADALLALVAENGYTVDPKYLQSRLSEGGAGVRKKPDVCMGRRIEPVQERFARRYGIAREEYEAAFDKLFDDDEVFRVGELEAKAVHLPGHTPDHMGYLIGDNIFCGDSLFNPDVGSARCDFPGGSTKDLFESAAKLLSLPTVLQNLHRPRLPPFRQRWRPVRPASFLDGRRAARAQQAPARRRRRGGLCGVAQRARRNTGRAAPDPPGRAGQHPRGEAAGAAAVAGGGGGKCRRRGGGEVTACANQGGWCSWGGMAW